MSSQGLVSIIGQFLNEYKSRTPVRLKLVDAYLAYVMLTGIIQFVYCLLVGTFPFNSFLSGFISCVGSFVLAGWLLYILVANACTHTHTHAREHTHTHTHTVCLRIQTNPENQTQFKISPERAFADFIFANLVLHLVVINFIG